LSEFDDVVRYLNAKVGRASSPSTFIRSADTTPHLDLGFAAHILTSTSTTAANATKARYVQMRRDWVNVIVWRAAAISGDSPGHPDALWVPSADGHTAHLADTVLDEIVDRRLRTCERMHHQVSSASALARGAVLRGTSPAGPWTDGFKIRMFEYPRIRVSRGAIGANLPAIIGAANIAEWDATATPAQHWRWENVHHRRIRWTDELTRMAPASAGNWTQTADYNVILSPAPGVTASNALATLFTPSTDWWGRSWMFCDHVVSALHVEALWLGLTRRTGSNTAFDDVLSTDTNYIQLSAFVGYHPPTPMLMGGGAEDTWFDNKSVPEADLQIGDQLILWNSYLYPFLLTAEWRLENSIVMDIDSDPATGSLRRDSLKLQGHGIDMRDYARYMAEIAGYLREGLAEVRNALVTFQAAHPTDTSFTFGPRNALVVRWDPYDTFTSLVTHASGAPTRIHGAWWVRVPLADRYPTVDSAVNAIPKSVRDDPSPGPGYHHPPPSTGSTVTDAVYFPLFEPASGWQAYFDLRRSGSTAAVQTTLREVHADGSLAPGLFASGVEGTPIAIVRAKVRP
jgi:hypothetical protein